MRYVAVIGKGRNCSAPLRSQAVTVGARLATLHPEVTLVCGGMGGVMHGAAEGMTAGGGTAIGLVPDVDAEPSPHLTYSLRTGLPVNHRNIVMASVADVAIVLPGSHGTLIEGWAMADRGVPLYACGAHAPSTTGALPFAGYLTADEIPGEIARALTLPATEAAC